MSDIRFTKLVEVLGNTQKNKNNVDTLTFGKIVSVDPLEIDIGNNVILTKDFLFLGQMCRPHKVKIPHTHEYNGDTENATATKDGDLTITTTGQAVTTVVEIMGHKHSIKKQVTEDVHEKGTDFEESVTIEIEPVLKKGDKVLMFAFNNYQMYYVAERIEE